MKRWCIGLMLSGWGLLIPLVAQAEKETSNPLLFTSWDTMEPDKIASIWLIKKYVSDKAEFRFYPKDSLLEEGIPFDIPTAEFRRKANLSCYETLLKHYHITDPRAVRIGKMIHDMESNLGRVPFDEETDQLYNELVRLILACDKGTPCVQPGLEILDKLK